MHSGRYVSSLAEAVRRRNLWLLMALLLAATNLGQVLFINSREHRERIVVIPPRLDKEFWVRGAMVSDSYLEQTAVYMTELALSYSPDNVRYRVRQVLLHADASAHGALSAVLEADAERIERNRVSAVFYPQSVRLRAAAHSAAIYGVHTRMIAGKVVDSRQTAVVVRFNGAENWKLIGLKEVDPNENDPFIAVTVSAVE